MNILIISLLYIGVLLIAAKLAEEGFSRIGLIPFLGPIFIGIILGGGVLDIIRINPIISFFTSLGIIFLLFIAGAEEIGGKIEFRKKLMISSIIQLTIPLIIIIYLLLYLDISNPLILSVPLVMTSVGPLTRLLTDLGISKSELGETIFYQGTLVEIASVILFSIFSSPIQRLPLMIVGVIGLFIFLAVLGSKFAKILDKIEENINTREIELATVIFSILLVGFIAEIVGFNSAIASLFLGYLLRDYLKERTDLLIKLKGITYGLFEPLFFVSIGLYFAKINYEILEIGLILFSAIFITKFLSGYLSAKIINVEKTVNGLGTSVKGGVDASLLISALTLGYIDSINYSISALAISLQALIIPVLFKVKSGYHVKKERKAFLENALGNLSLVFSTCNESLREIIRKINENDLTAIVIVNNEMSPIGYVSVEDLLEIEPSLYEKLTACDLILRDLPRINKKEKIRTALRKFEETRVPIIAVVDDESKIVGTLYEKELLKYISRF
ncbi:sodium:proton antiporter [Candidatus Acidianus copahuensis]|uniref:Sodium:proton antiporter n=1 Tax=Candidatus Acidianus copahuensis TaxID=1160895 RepID=A0A031LMF5_9CREN|nr:cation:proton antiporter [Candidatus Acidianus copahuensis]EZQ02083.1 sodium:proton antiporter [Candidatus Acidianus copahuensis]